MSNRTLAIVAAVAALGMSTAPAAASEGPSVRVKFTDASDVRLAGARVEAPAGGAQEALEAVLAEHGRPRAHRLFRGDAADLAHDHEALERRSGRRLKDLDAYFDVRLDDEESAAALVADLAALPFVERAYVEPPPPPPAATPDFSAALRFASAAPVGIGANAGASVPGGTGDRVRVAGIDYSWNRQHEDLTRLAPASAFAANGTPWDPFGSLEHGTAAMGEIFADANAFGVSGLARDAAPLLVNAANTEIGWDVANAVTTARQRLGAGDVLVIVQQAWGPNGTLVPVEWVPEVYDAISYATAAGIIVVEAAGNGGADLDGLPTGRPDSGAIIAGAGAAPDCSGAPARSRLGFSNFGSRVDLQGWGECVTTTGYGTLWAGGANSGYTATFDGTSSATPIVAAAAAELSSAYEAKHGVPPTPAQVRSVLKSTGTAQAATGLAGNIGPLPNLSEALASVGVLRATSEPPSGNLVLNPSFETGVSGWSASQATASRVALAGAPQGASVARIARTAGTSYSLSQGDIATTTAGGTHIAAASVRAASSSSVGKQIRLTLRELTPAGAVAREVSTAATLSNAFARVAVALDATAAGNRVSLRVEQLGAGAGNAFYLDGVSLTAASNVLGSATVGNVWTPLNPDAKRVSAAALRPTTPTDVSKLRVYVDGGGPVSGTSRVRGVIYTNAGGQPGTLVARTAEATVVSGSGARWLELSFSAPVRLSPGTYWLGLHTGGAAAGRYAAVARAGALRNNNDAYSDGAATAFGAGAVTDKELSLHAIGG